MVYDWIEKEGIQGHVAELGVYEDNTAYVLAGLARRKKRKAHLFDTFESLPDRDLVGIDFEIKNRKSDIDDTTLEEV
jgi:Macrocin-O-methyltransferase (TylF)